MRLRFEDFTFDTERRELLRGSEPLHLPPKAFQLLEILVENRPNPVPQQQLYDSLWPQTFVEETNLHKIIFQLREALDDRKREIIRTVYGYGFAFAAAASEIEAGSIPQFQIVIGDREFKLREGENIVGREWDAAVRIDSPSISRHHARIVVNGERASVEDLGSKNGTTVGGRRIRAATDLTGGERILFGTIAAVFQVIPPSQSTETG